jgi:hypothetical protein
LYTKINITKGILHDEKEIWRLKNFKKGNLLFIGAFSIHTSASFLKFKKPTTFVFILVINQ